MIDSFKMVTPFPVEEDQHFTSYIIRPFQPMIYFGFKYLTLDLGKKYNHRLYNYLWINFTSSRFGFIS
jgi:hypothetical protein